MKCVFETCVRGMCVREECIWIVFARRVHIICSWEDMDIKCVFERFDRKRFGCKQNVLRIATTQQVSRE